MHLAEGMLPLEQAIGWSIAGTAAVAWSIRGEIKAQQNTTLPSFIIAGITSLLFAVTLLPLPVPVVGATSHICLTPVLALMIGIRRIIWPTFFVLLLQAIFFAHGGLTTLGINTLTLGLVGPLFATGLWILLQRFNIGNIPALAIVCAVGDLSIYIVDALILAVALADLSEPLVTFTSVVIGFAPVQIPLAALEAAASVAMIRLLATRRPDLLPESLRRLRKRSIPLVTVTLCMFIASLTGCDYEGIDGSVFGATAESVGRSPKDSIVDLSQGELGLAMSILILFGLGFIAGRTWERIFHVKNDALPR